MEGTAKRDNPNLARGRRWFEYHCYEGEDSSDAEAWHHTHQKVDVLYRLKGVDPEIGAMYKIRFSDGVEWDVFSDELVADPSEFYRPDYKAGAKWVPDKPIKPVHKAKQGSGRKATGMGKSK